MNHSELKRLCRDNVYDGYEYVQHLNKSIYELKQASMVWHATLKDELSKLKFVQGTSDPCLFIATVKGGRRCYLLVYVDDIIIAGGTKQECESVVRTLEISKHKLDLVKITHDREQLLDAT